MKDRILSRGQTSGRSDDNEEVFKNRIKVYQEKTVPILDYYREQKKLHMVSAEGSKEECFGLVEEELKKMQLSHFKKICGMKKYMKKEMDKFIRPLVVYLMKEQPEDIHGAIKYWIDNEGLKIKEQLLEEAK